MWSLINDISSISFANPYFFALLLVVPLYFFYQKKKSTTSFFRLSSTAAIASQKGNWKVKTAWIVNALNYIVFICCVIALARPQTSNVSESIDSEGIDIVLSMDISGSMLAEDLKPNRIEAAKMVAINFIDQRPSDRIGLVIFSGESFTQCPITSDHGVLKTQLAALKSGLLQDGTAIGMGLATGVDRLRSAKGKSKVLILLTDGVNNTGLIDPMNALEIAKSYGVRVYTIGVGTTGKAPYPQTMPDGSVQKTMMEVQIDGALLTKIANETGGKYYRATGNSALESVYKEIDRLEKTKIEMSAYRHYKECFGIFLWIAIIALILQVSLQLWVYRKITL